MIISIVFCTYISIIFFIGIVSYFYTQNLKDYMLGGRSLSGPIAALGAGASDMSSWLLLALPGAVFVNGLNEIWLPIGLVLGAYLNWKVVAKRLRIYTEIAKDSITIPAFLDNRFEDSTGMLRLLTAAVILIFFTFYTASGFVAGGLLFSSTFNVNYEYGMYITAIVVLVYTSIGGFLAISWIDFFQGCLMFVALLVVPAVIFNNLEGYSHIINGIDTKSPELLNPFYNISIASTLSLLAWGLGYFGQPHILVRFMATKNEKVIPQARIICMSWMSLALVGAVLTGIFSIVFFQGTLIKSPETIFIILSKTLFNPWIGGILLAAVLSATMSTASAQLLASSSAVVEDFYHKFLRKNAGSKELLITSRIIVTLITIVAVFMAHDPKSSILNLVGHAWAGLGASFGPIIIISLFWRNVNWYGALSGIIVGALVVIIWPMMKSFSPIFEVYELLPGFVLSFLAIVIFSKVFKDKNSEKITKLFNTFEKKL
ncbi:sodium/proline symporter PutP [Paraphotobacterium marinum]|uniref:sodium/proline symporter PutP n=1 Tax=Paraphotobacterium marinum TaxID=1755811 RepID=UPI0039EC8F4E